METFTIKGKGTVKKPLDYEDCREEDCIKNINSKCILRPKPTASTKDNICVEYKTKAQG